MSNPYYNPEKHGLTIVGELEDTTLSYEFSMFVVWKDACNRLYWADDSGCSCPSPFEDIYSVSDLSTGSRSNCARAITEWVDGDSQYAEAATRLKAAVREVTTP